VLKPVLECVVNVSEGRDEAVLAALAKACGGDLLDVHTDPHHHRSVFTLVGEEAPRALAAAAVDRLTLAGHDGVHPRIGVVDVVPFVPLGGATLAEAVAARDAFGAWAAETLGLPCFWYGPERTLPEVRREAWDSLAPDVGPPHPHPTAGAAAVGARLPLVAYNLWLAGADLATARTVAAELRSPAVRALGLAVGDEVQVSMNLVDPGVVGPAQVHDQVTARVQVARAELVGLVPQAVLDGVDVDRWDELDLAADRTIEARWAAAGGGPGLSS
jgi:glutamate formiminotransferase / 5-formyltetrahydrofolate cyclo-ligase